MKLATFNINGIKARAANLERWLDQAQPDVLLMQEIKSIDEAFPRALFEDRGYHLETHGQKGFNGVAIASKYPLEDVRCGLPGDDEDVQARWIEATIVGERALRLCCLYLPNGNPVTFEDGVPSEKYAYKLNWMARMEARARDIMAEEIPVVFAGDYNIIPQAEDAAKPDSWREDAAFLPLSREAYRKFMLLGLTDAFRARNPAPDNYSFWDYQAGAWQRNNGIRIDHILLCPQAADMLRDCYIEKDVRATEKPSDHVPVWAELEID